PGAVAAPARPRRRAGAAATDGRGAHPVNPLRDPRDRRLPRLPEPCVLVIFGAAGDLAQRKLLPAVYDLSNRGLLPPEFAVIGFGRRDWDDAEFAAAARRAAEHGARTPWREDVWRRLADGIRFINGVFEDDDAFDRLAVILDELGQRRGGTGVNAAFYLSVPPRAFPVVLKQLA